MYSTQPESRFGSSNGGSTSDYALLQTGDGTQLNHQTCTSTFDLQVRPIFHRLADRVKAHIFLCMLAYYVEWHLRLALAPLIFDEDAPQEATAKRASVVEKAPRSDSAIRKIKRKQTVEELPVHSFQSLLADLATVVKNHIQPKLETTSAFDKVTQPTPLQQKAFELLGVHL
jgi:hypothetical protein